MSTTEPAPVLVCPGCGSRDVDLRRGSLCGTCADAVPVTTAFPGYWHERWLAAVERADEDGAQAISQHVRILELERQLMAAEAQLAEVRQAVTTFLTHYGHSELPSFKVANDLAEGIRQVLDRKPLPPGEAGTTSPARQEEATPEGRTGP